MHPNLILLVLFKNIIKKKKRNIFDQLTQIFRNPLEGNASIFFFWPYSQAYMQDSMLPGCYGVFNDEIDEN